MEPYLLSSYPVEPSTMKVLPWHLNNWNRLTDQITQNKLPHAILISGAVGLGKLIIARNLASLLLCKYSHNSIACDSCNSCLMIKANCHPDLTEISASEGRNIIVIDQIRELIEKLDKTSHQGGWRIAIIKEAELLNTAASNALLKTLEEPMSRGLIILTTANVRLLTATIRSRCQLVSIQSPSYDAVESWLTRRLSPEVDAKLLFSLSENSPLKALKLGSKEFLERRKAIFKILYDLAIGHGDLEEAIALTMESEIDELALMLMGITLDLIKMKFLVSDHIVNRDKLNELETLVSRSIIDNLMIYQKNLYKLREHIAGKFNLNRQLLLEALFIDWSKCFA